MSHLSINLPRSPEAHNLTLTLPALPTPVSWRVYISPELGLTEVCGLTENLMNVRLTQLSLVAITEAAADGKSITVEIHPAPFNPSATALEGACLTKG